MKFCFALLCVLTTSVGASTMDAIVDSAVDTFKHSSGVPTKDFKTFLAGVDKDEENESSDSSASTEAKKTRSLDHADDHDDWENEHEDRVPTLFSRAFGVVLVIGILGCIIAALCKCQICPSCCTYTALVVALGALCSFSLPLSAPFSRGVISGLSRECLPRMSQNQVTRAAAAPARG